MKITLARVLCLLFISLLAPPIVADDYIHERGGCPNAFRKFAESQKTAAYTKITFFGGSITEGRREQAGTVLPRIGNAATAAGLSRRGAGGEQLGHRRHRIVAGRVSHQ